MSETVVKILEAAIEEFAQKGFEAASTNKIAERANVAKGLLFHYFESKENLYIECYRHVLNWTKEKFDEFVLNSSHEDFFEFLKDWSLHKIKLAAENPTYSKFLLTMTNLPSPLRGTILNMIKENVLNSTGVLYEKLKRVQLREGISHEDALRFVIAVFEGLGDWYLNQYRDEPERLLKDLQRILLDADKFLDMIKFGLLPRK